MPPSAGGNIATLEELLRGGNRRQVEALIRDRTQTVPLPDGSVLCRALGRFKMFTDAADGGIAPHLLLDGYWEYWWTEFVCRNVARGGDGLRHRRVYGYYSILLADLVGSEGGSSPSSPIPAVLAAQAHKAVNGLTGLVVATHRPAAMRKAGMRRSACGAAHRPADRPLRLALRPSTTTGRSSPQGGGAGGLRDGQRGFPAHRRGSAAADIEAGMAGDGPQPGLRLLLEFDADRCAQAPAMLEALATRYPLHFVDGDSRAKPCTAEDLLTRRRVATLYLSQVEPR